MCHAPHRLPRSLIDFNIYAGLLAYDELGVEPQLDAEGFISARRRQHTAHEVGAHHGLPPQLHRGSGQPQLG